MTTTMMNTNNVRNMYESNMNRSNKNKKETTIMTTTMMNTNNVRNMYESNMNRSNKNEKETTIMTTTMMNTNNVRSMYESNMNRSNKNEKETTTMTTTMNMNAVNLMKTRLVAFRIAMAVIFCALFSLASTIAGFAYSYTTSGVFKTTDIYAEQYDQIIEVLRRQAMNPNYDGTLEDAGITVNSYKEARTLADAFRDQVLIGDSQIGIWVGEGYAEYWISDYDSSHVKTYSFRGENPATRNRILVGWNPAADRVKEMQKYDEANARLQAILASAPENNYEKIKYFNNAICDMMEYDDIGYSAGNGKHDPYYGLVEGTGVCDCYSGCFFNLCMRSGIVASVASCIVPKADGSEGRHSINGVYTGSEWREVDVCWNDGRDRTRYFMTPLGENWQKAMSEDYMVLRAL